MAKKQTIKQIQLTDLIAPSFYDLYWYIQWGNYIHYWLKGGRGSTKSSFVSLMIIQSMVANPSINAVVIRKTGTELRGSVYEQIMWAIEALGMTDLWNPSVSPMQITYKPTGQRIVFRGLDVAKKTKSIKFRRGHCGIVWYEELDEFDGMEEIRTANQSFIRGGEKFIAFYTYNPPKSANSWVNAEAQRSRPDRYVHHSDYLSVPREWLGEQFIIEAEHLKLNNPEAYRHEYLGEATGTGGEVFRNVRLEPITDEQISQFENKRRGLDFGYAVDPVAYGAMHYDRKHKTLYIFHEFFKVGVSNSKLYDEIVKENTNNDLIYADSAEPKSIAELAQYGLRVAGVRKGKDSVEYGVKFMQDLEAIVIDDERCPNAAREFLEYELARDSYGEFKDGFPDKNNHMIDMSRYALSADIMQHRPDKVKQQSKFAENSLEWRIEQHRNKLIKQKKRGAAW